ncbi:MULTISPECIES: acyl-homoserine-lactone synthase LuxM [Vibrio]|uniref:acyl-homoserine-lactone synthase n=3 Tax=Vibrio TaxID=662 RepID=A0A2N7NMY0_9VIBR|nr:acyl-homoserine-lactone synthase LuxM [Vibrio tasmaniensis]PMP17339.1 acyl-homoserine-lactone synthase [Vibrio tasmaniensis]TKG33742.1 acyl-homoserine-lactone synthase LuxM [Vibrio tasmaniensis]TKG43601.1 acyl-homoserine-lactone synthase LuxM [Vibrio tasmaniensis]TKG43656.1 acyl-homoserine-lactone synthase LuxM [Vibrio tasmaniensis]TKG43679.1 acyl-homoserine-lactone synthase LuxM [Vibrio tasmaniensis]
MELMSSLGSLLASSLPIEKKQHALVELVLHTYQPQERTAVFKTVTEYRRNQLELLFPEHQAKSDSVMFEVIDYRDLIQRYPNTLSTEVALLEEAVGQCYIHWLDFWCECEISAIKAKLPLSTHALYPMDLPIKDSAYYGVIIDQIENSQLIVQTPTRPQGLPISDAIALSNLEVFIKGEKWYEMLPLLHLSQTGKHFILLKHPTDEAFPTLVSSALIQDWSKYETWLSYAPPFCNDKWKYSLSRRGYEGLAELHIFTPPALSKCDSIPEFDNKFQLQLAEMQAVCEILRLTVSGNIQQKVYFLYLAQKEMLNLLHQAGYKIGFTIIDQPLILDFYKAIEPQAYLPLGSCDLNETNLLTYRGLWNIELMLKAFNHVNFRDYRRCLRENKNTAWQII